MGWGCCPPTQPQVLCGHPVGYHTSGTAAPGSPKLGPDRSGVTGTRTALPECLAGSGSLPVDLWRVALATLVHATGCLLQKREAPQHTAPRSPSGRVAFFPLSGFGTVRVPRGSDGVFREQRCGSPASPLRLACVQ